MTTKRNPLTTTHGKNGVPEMQAITPEDEYLGLDIPTMDQLQGIIRGHARRANECRDHAEADASLAVDSDRHGDQWMACADSSLELARSNVLLAMAANSLLPTIERMRMSRELVALQRLIEIAGVRVEETRRRLEGAS